ncbi:hypothetical protein MNBD_CHLOROFLEXI01-4768 [hydrothermal vent metagenome]|uniref:Uncharacterized protein n=1 Tax=hydrothermal vent metagenome TaxID=652676 RepID=A0A3B0UZX0_9ZZZZ
MNSQNTTYYVVELFQQKEPEECWQSLLEYAFLVAEVDLVEFAVSGKDSKYPEQLKSFSSLLVTQFSSRWKWFSKQIGYTTFFQFRLNQDLFNFICTIPQLDAWSGNFPEDPTFYRKNTPILWSISHDGIAFILLTEQEAKQFRRDGFDFKLMPSSNNTYLHGSVIQ